MERNVLVEKLLLVDNRRRLNRNNSGIHRKSRKVIIVNKAYRYRLYPTTDQKIMFAELSAVPDSSITRCLASALTTIKKRARS